MHVEANQHLYNEDGDLLVLSGTSGIALGIMEDLLIVRFDTGVHTLCQLQELTTERPQRLSIVCDDGSITHFVKRLTE